MKIESDSDTGLVYLRLTDAKVAYSVDIGEGAYADFAENGSLVGVETADLGASVKDYTEVLVRARTSTKGPGAAEEDDEDEGEDDEDD